METLVPRAMDGGLKNSDVFLQVFGEKGFARKVGGERERVRGRIGLR